METTDTVADAEKKKRKSNDLVTESASDSAMSEEDKALKERLETCVSTLTGKPIENADLDPVFVDVEQEKPSTLIQLKALQLIATELRSATSSMTAVPKPLKFLHPHYDDLVQFDQGLPVKSTVAEEVLLRGRMADVLSVLAMTFGDSGKYSGRFATDVFFSFDNDLTILFYFLDKRESLRYKLKAFKTYDAITQLPSEFPAELLPDNKNDNLGCWGHEFVRSLAGEIGAEYNARIINGADPDDDAPFQDLLGMVDSIVPFHITHNAEAEAVDLLMEVQRLSKLLTLTNGSIDENNYKRICLYLIKSADFMSDPDDLSEVLGVAHDVFLSQGQYFDALRAALRLGKSDDDLKALLNTCDDNLVKKQMCLLLARNRTNLDYSEEDDDLNDLIGNSILSEQFHSLGRDLDVVDAKTPEDIYKSHLSETGGFTRSRRDSASQVDSARANLASTFVNAFVNAGFGHDKLMTENDSEWLYKNKDHGMMSAAASLGMILLWNVEEGLAQIDKFLYSNDDYVKAGAALAVGILSSGVRNDADPALALLQEHVEDPSINHTMKCAAITGLGIAYAGSKRSDVMELLVAIIETEGGNMLEISLASLALGMIFIGSCDDNAGTTILQRLMESTETELNHSHARLIFVGLGLLFMGKLDQCDAMLEAIGTIEHKISSYGAVLLESCAYARSGNVLEVQRMMHKCTEHLTEDAEHQAAAVIGIALISMGEGVGCEMTIRAFDHLLHYCELPIKRTVPLALSLMYISNPEFSAIDTLSRLSHDPDAEISQNAIMGLGIISAGTNNSRVAGLLRQLSDFYNKEADHMFCVRIAQGLLHMGKGLLTINPIHSDGMLTNLPALGAIVTVLHLCLDIKSSLLDKTHYLLYYLTCAMNPRMLITVDEDISWKPVTVRVGQAVETVGQAGKPKTITGFQTHTTPVLLGSKERAELGTEEVLSVASVLEGIVILKENPDYEPEGEEEK